MTPPDDITAMTPGAIRAFLDNTFYYKLIEGHLRSIPAPTDSHWYFGYVGPHHRFQISLADNDGSVVVSRTFSFEDYPISPDEIMMGFGNLCNTMVKVFPKYIQRANDRRAANLLPAD